MALVFMELLVVILLVVSGKPCLSLWVKVIHTFLSGQTVLQQFESDTARLEDRRLRR